MAVLTFLLSLSLTFIFQSFDILGTIRDVKGQPVSGVRVSLLDENYQPTYTAFVDPGGRFTIKGIRSGRYIVRIDTTGTPYQELQTGWLELQSLRQLGGGREVYPVDLVLKFRPGSKPKVNFGTTFAQDVPPAARSEFEWAAKRLKGSKRDQAIASLKKAVELFPDYFDALELLGTEYVKSAQYDAALSVLQHAIDVNGRAPRSLYALGVTYLKLNRLPEAVETLEKSLKLDASNPNAQMMLGLALGNNRQFAEAEEAFRNALQIGGAGVAEAHFYLAGIYDKQQRYAEAARELEMYLKESKDISDPEKIRAMIAKLNAKAVK